MVTSSPQDCFTRVGSVNTRYRVQGTNGNPLLLIHGLGSCLEDWDLNAGPLSEVHRVYRLDLVGHGQSDKPAAPYTMEYFCKFIRDFLRTEGLDRVSLVGSSMGGTIALDVAIRYPDLVDRLVLVDPAGLGREMTFLFRLCTLPLLGKQLTKPSLKGTEQLQRTFFYNQSLVTPERVKLEYEYASLPGAQEALLTIIRTNMNLLGVKQTYVEYAVDHLPRVAAPTLVVWGRDDKTVPVAQAEVARKLMPNVQVHIFDKCGHAAMMDRAEDFNKLALEFLA